MQVRAWHERGMCMEPLPKLHSQAPHGGHMPDGFHVTYGVQRTLQLHMSSHTLLLAPGASKRHTQSSTHTQSQQHQMRSLHPSPRCPHTTSATAPSTQPLTDQGSLDLPVMVHRTLSTLSSCCHMRRMRTLGLLHATTPARRSARSSSLYLPRPLNQCCEGVLEGRG